MFVLSRVFVLAAFYAALASACGDDHDHAHTHSRRMSVSPSLITPPTRPLVWGDVNFISTTDTHGWLLGHQKASEPEPNYSGDFGDYASFVHHMKKIAEEKGVDLLLVDSGDLHDGTGLSDGYPAGSVDGHETNQFIKQLPYDVLAIGNHELYVYNITRDMHTDFAPHWNGRYLSSNANVTIPDPNDASQNVSVPVGSRFAKFTTPLGRQVTALGVLFDFTGNDDGTTVQKVEDMVKEEWFLDAIQEEPDFFLLAGHMPLAEDNWPTVFNAIRAVHNDTPILIFGGHSHIRDCTQLDGRSMSLQAGRYMETVGWMSVNFTDSTTGNLTFSRRYLDPNRITYEFHTGQSNSSFDTHKGLAMKEGLNALFAEYDLGVTYGTAPQDFTITRAQYPGNDSALSLFIETAAPAALAINNTRSSIPAYYIVNSGVLRFDMFKGTFERNDELTASPFKDAFVYLPNVTFGTAKQIVPALNDASTSSKKRGLRRKWIEELYARGEIEMRYNAWLEEMYKRSEETELSRRDDDSATIGYVTTDTCPGNTDGDDTTHIAMPYYASPTYISSNEPAGVDDGTEIDLVFLDYIETDVIDILNEVQSDKSFVEADITSYSPLYTNQVLGVYAQNYWN